MKWNSPKFINIRYRVTVFISKLFNSKLFWLQVCAVGRCIMVIQGFIHEDSGAQKVYVVGGNLDAQVLGSVDVTNTVDVNLEEVIGHTVGCHRSYTKGGREYQAIDVFKSNW